MGNIYECMLIFLVCIHTGGILSVQEFSFDTMHIGTVGKYGADLKNMPK